MRKALPSLDKAITEKNFQAVAEDGEERIACETCEVMTASGVIKDEGGRKGLGATKCWADLGTGDITVGSAADESCWPEDQGGAFETKPCKKNIILMTANGGETGKIN